MTLNQIKYKLIDYFKTHAQLKDVVYKDDFDFNAETGLEFPVANIQYLGSNMSGKQTNRNYRINLVDLMDDNVEGIEDEIVSDMEQVVEDFVTWLDFQEGLIFNKQARVNAVVGYSVNRLTGVEVLLTISTMRPQNECVQPNRNYLL